MHSEKKKEPILWKGEPEYVYIYREREARNPRSPERQHGDSTERSHWEADPFSAWSLCGHLLPLQYRLNAEHLGFPSSLAARTYYTELDIVTDIRVPGRLCFRKRRKNLPSNNNRAERKRVWGHLMASVSSKA